MTETQDKYLELLAVNRELVEERESSQQESYEVTEYLRKEILAKKEKILALEAQLDEQERKSAQEKLEINQGNNRYLEKVKQQHKNQEFELQRQIQNLNSELNAVREFKERKNEVETMMEKLKTDNKEMKRIQEEELAEMERKFVEQNTKQRKDFEQRLEALKRSAEEDIDERLDATVKRILQQNRRMAEELRLHVQETDELKKAKDILEEENRELLRELEIKSEMEQEYALRGSKQQRQIKKANEKIQSLEKTISNAFGDFHTQRASAAKKSQSSINELTSENGSLKRLLKLKSQELKNIRRLAQEVLAQRSDVEAFLISSLDLVRRQIARENTALPPLYASSRSAFAGPAEKVSIHDLTWPDREKVLRSLFAKINNQAKQAHLANLPAHSFQKTTGRLDTSSTFPLPPTAGGVSTLPSTANSIGRGGRSEGKQAPIA